MVTKGSVQRVECYPMASMDSTDDYLYPRVPSSTKSGPIHTWAVRITLLLQWVEVGVFLFISCPILWLTFTFLSLALLLRCISKALASVTMCWTTGFEFSWVVKRIAPKVLVVWTSLIEKHGICIARAGRLRSGHMWRSTQTDVYREWATQATLLLCKVSGLVEGSINNQCYR